MKSWTAVLCLLALGIALTLLTPGCENGGSNNSDGTDNPTNGTSVLVAPAPITPANGATLTSFPRTVTLTWSSVPGAAQYGVQIQLDTGAWEDVVNTTISGTTFSTTIGGDNPCRWRVWGIDAGGNAGPQSGWSSFQFQTGP